MQEKIKRQRTTKETRLAHVEKWRQSGLSMSAYSREANISLPNLSKWIRAENKPIFKPVSVSEMVTSAQGGVIEIVTDTRVKIRLPQTTNPSTIVHIVRGLAQCN